MIEYGCYERGNEEIWGPFSGGGDSNTEEKAGQINGTMNIFKSHRESHCFMFTQNYIYVDYMYMCTYISYSFMFTQKYIYIYKSTYIITYVCVYMPYIVH